VTSNPSPQYVERVAKVFNDNGAHVRGDLKGRGARALLDPEARGPVKDDTSYGRLREPAQYVVALGVRSTAKSDGVFFRAQSAALQQPVFQAPSVFNFYPPGLRWSRARTCSGPSSRCRIRRRRFARINFVNSLSTDHQSRRDRLWRHGLSARLEAASPLSPELRTALVDKVDRLLLHGTLSAAAHDAIVTASRRINASDALGRAKAAFYLVATSSHYQGGALTWIAEPFSADRRVEQRAARRRPRSLPLAAHAASTDYKALVCVFLFGGVDGNHVLVPTDSAAMALTPRFAARTPGSSSPSRASADQPDVPRIRTARSGFTGTHRGQDAVRCAQARVACQLSAC
jgi:hypothetical protein